ncbi:MAG: FkbM family methyltransferase [Bacteroidales bacterium]|nr:FkbM family methyltransferase [Bacteroidales bacterium]
MLFRIFKIVFNPFINRVVSRIFKPFGKVLPERFLFPVCGFFKLRISNFCSIYIEGHYSSFITRKLFWQGIRGFEFDSVSIFLDIIKKSNVFFDIGANLGYYTLLAKAVNPDVKVYAFEPFPDAIKALENNIIKNKFENIKIVKTALADKMGEDILYYRINDDFPEGLQLAGNNSMVDFKDNRDQKAVIKTQTFDFFVEQNNITSLDFIKIDTETTEHLILSNGKKSLQKFRPLILCEVLPGNNEKQLEELFISLEYVFCRVCKSGVTLLQKLQLLGKEENDFFFVPKEKIEVIKPYIRF